MCCQASPLQVGLMKTMSKRQCVNRNQTRSLVVPSRPIATHYCSYSSTPKTETEKQWFRPKTAVSVTVTIIIVTNRKRIGWPHNTANRHTAAKFPYLLNWFKFCSHVVKWVLRPTWLQLQMSWVGLVFKCNVWTRMFEAKNHLLCFIDLRFFALHFTFVLK